MEFGIAHDRKYSRDHLWFQEKDDRLVVGISDYLASEIGDILRVILPHSNTEIDAIIIGAVSKYPNSYQTQNGEIKSSLGSSIEFGSFLISTRTGEVLWGARFVGSQPTGLLNARGKWLSEEQLSQAAMKKILKAFHGNSKRIN
jgi:hypothetical protein